MEQFFDVLAKYGLIAPLTGFLIALLALGQAWAKKMFEQYNINNAVKKANDTVWKVVFQLAQDTADDLKSYSLDGKLTADEQNMLRTNAINRSMDLMGKETAALLDSYTTDLYKWMGATVDTMARMAKKAVEEGKMEAPK